MKARPRVTREATLAVLLLTACSNDTATSGASPAAPSSPAAPRAPSPVAAAPAAKPRAAGVASAQEAHASKRRLDAADEAKRHSYIEALSLGRAATRARKYEDAIHAFDEAVAQDQDGRAYAERGYVLYLLKRNDAALKDFDQALRVPEGDTLLSQVMWNRGLAFTGLGRSGDADLAFYWANRLHPSKATLERVTGKKVCPVTLDRTRVPAHAYDGWRAWGDAMKAADTDGLASVGYVRGGTEERARAALCPDCKGEGPWTVAFGNFEEAFPRAVDTHVLAARGGKLWDFGVFGSGLTGLASGEVCGGNDDVRLSASAGHTVVHATSSPLSRSPVKIDGDGNVVGDCPYDSAWGDCLRMCLGSRTTDTFTLLDVSDVSDVSAPARALALTETTYYARAEAASPAPVKVQVDAEGFTLEGEGCRAVAFP